MENVIVKQSPIAGKGLFALRDFKKNEMIFRVSGPTIYYSFEPDYRVGPHWLQIGPRMWKMPMNGNPWRHLNHSCEPVAGLRRESDVIAMRFIRAGEEITIDYSLAEGSKKWRMNCSCKASTCRGVIRGAQFLPRELFEKYKDFIPTYLKKVYLKEKVYTPKLQARKGVFAKHALKKGEIIFRVEGPIVRYKFPPNYRKGYQWLALAPNSWIIPLRTNPWWSIHHSCDPNVGVIGKGDVITMRDIKPDEELTVDDSTTEADTRWKHQCTCGKKNCRKLIRSVQFYRRSCLKRINPSCRLF